MGKNWNAGGENQSPSYPPLLKGEAGGLREVQDGHIV